MTKLKIKFILAALITLWVSVAFAQSDWHSAFMAKAAKQGCVVDDALIEMEKSEGVDEADIDEYLHSLVNENHASKGGGVFILDAATCTIALPEITSDYTLDDPNIAKHIVRAEIAEGSSDQACYLDNDAIYDIMRERTSNEMELADTWVTFIASEIIKGRIVFFQDEPFRVPLSFQYLSGDCTEVANIDAVKKSQRVFRDRFDATIREGSKHAKCGFEYDNLFANEMFPYFRKLQEEGGNRAYHIEYLVVAVAAGWMERSPEVIKQTFPVPPLCQY